MEIVTTTPAAAVPKLTTQQAVILTAMLGVIMCEKKDFLDDLSKRLGFPVEEDSIQVPENKAIIQQLYAEEFYDLLPIEVKDEPAAPANDEAPALTLVSTEPAAA